MRHHSKVPDKEMDSEKPIYGYLAWRWILRDHSRIPSREMDSERPL